MDTLTSWFAQHPSDAAWAVFGFLTVLVIVFNRSEPKLRTIVIQTKTKTDDKLFRVFGTCIGYMAVVLTAIREVVPHGVARQRRIPKIVDVKIETTEIAEDTDGRNEKKEK